MKKGTRARRCFNCGTIVAWAIPIKVEFGFPNSELKTLPNFAPYKKYCCKACKERIDKGEIDAKR